MTRDGNPLRHSANLQLRACSNPQMSSLVECNMHSLVHTRSLRPPTMEHKGGEGGGREGNSPMNTRSTSHSLAVPTRTSLGVDCAANEALPIPPPADPRSTVVPGLDTPLNRGHNTGFTERAMKLRRLLTPADCHWLSCTVRGVTCLDCHMIIT